MGTYLQCFPTTLDQMSGLSSIPTQKASVAGFHLLSLHSMLNHVCRLILVKILSFIPPSGTSPLPELQSSLIPHHEVLGTCFWNMVVEPLLEDVYSLGFIHTGQNGFGLSITNPLLLLSSLFLLSFLR